jgi:glyoxylase-like metal-dependent hydrolase (beta-lactamase superfamily II)
LLLTTPGEVFTTLAPNLIEDALRDAFLPAGPMRIEQNILLLDLDGELAVLDNGMGSSQLFGPHAGHLLRSLSEAGVQPEQIGAMVLSHAHPDHCWGTMCDDGAPTFPNAAIYMAEEELAFWEHCDHPEMTAVIEGVQKHLVPLRHRMRFFRDNEEFLPGVRAIAAPGHTPGHTIFLVSSRDEQLCVSCDVTFHDPLSYAFPASESAYDYDKALGASTRIKNADVARRYAPAHFELSRALAGDRTCGERRRRISVCTGANHQAPGLTGASTARAQLTRRF